jgi:hypothetical protein
VAPFNRVFDGCAQRGQHDCDRSHIRVGAAVLIRSQAMVVTRCTMIMNYLPLISATVIMLVILAFAAEASSQ